MTDPQSLDEIDQSILHILSLYEHLSLLEVWCEIGEAGNLEKVREDEILSRLQSLAAKGFVECLTPGKGDVRWALVKDE